MSKKAIKISVSEIEENIKKHGHNFHCKVVSFLSDNGWDVTPNAYYVDNLTDKPREIDIIARKIINVLDPFFHGSKIFGEIYFYLLVECKCVGENNGTVFWFKENNKDEMMGVLNRYISPYIFKNSDNIELQKHHLFKPCSAATMHAVLNNNNNDFIQDAIGQVLHSLIYFRNKRNGGIPIMDDGERKNILEIYYPIIVLNNFDNFFKKKLFDYTKPAEELNDRFIMGVNYSFKTDYNKCIKEYIPIDIVNFNQLPNLLSEIVDVDFVVLQDRWQCGIREEAERNPNLLNNI